MNAQIFVQRREDLNPRKALESISKNKDTKLVIIYTCLKDDKTSKEFFDYFVKNLKTPFIGVKVSGLITPKEGYCEDAVSITTLSGDFEVKIISEEIDYKNPSNTANNLIQKIDSSGVCLTFTASYLWHLSAIDAVLRRVQAKYPSLKIYGGGSAPEPIVATNQGVFSNHIVCASIKNLGCTLDIFSGFRFDNDRNETLTITKSDELHIYEINGKNAGTEYSKIQHVRPYFFNTMAKLITKPDLATISKKVAQMNPRLFEGVLKFSTNLLGTEVEENVVEPMAVFKIDEGGEGLTIANHKPVNTVLRRVSSEKEDQLEVYNKIADKFSNSALLFINSCTYTIYWMDFDFENAERNLKKLKKPYLVAFFWGEYKTPIKGETNIVHNCISDVMAIE